MPTRIRRVAAAAAAALTALVGMACADANPLTPLPAPGANAVAVSFTGGTVKAELAATRAARGTGLMNRASIAADSGMLFVWPTDQQPQFAAFYMRNTHFDLSIAFLDSTRKVLNIEEMTKDTETLHFATGLFRYALEAPRGWFAAHGVARGAIANFTLPTGLIIEP